MSRKNKVIILFLLMLGSSIAFTSSQKSGHPSATAFFAFASAGLLIGIIATALSRSESRDDVRSSKRDD